MDQAPFRPDQTVPAPAVFRDALAKLVQVGVRVAEMIGEVADAEKALARLTAQAGVADVVLPLATSLAEAIEADRATAAAVEALGTVAARTETIAGAFARVSRAIRLTVMLAERMDRFWARGGPADDRHSMARRQIARGVADAIGREAEGERAERLTEALGERLDRMDTEAGIGDRPVQEIIDEICHDLGLDPARMTVRPPLRGVDPVAEASGTVPFAASGRTGGGTGWDAQAPTRRPDG